MESEKIHTSPIFNGYWCWEVFSFGINVGKPHKCVGWKLYIGLDIAFLTIWIYFNKIK